MRFVAENFNEEEIKVLNKYFTNVDKPVFCIVNLPEAVKAALFARYSRTSKSLRRLYLDEFANSTDYMFNNINLQTHKKAVDLFDKVFFEFGDDSVAQLGAIHIACEFSSNILTKVLEHGRLGSYLEQSTRYIKFNDKVNDSYRYYVPSELNDIDSQYYQNTMNKLFDLYGFLYPIIQSKYEKKYPDSKSTVLKAQVCDILRGLLPACTTSNLGMFLSGQSLEMLLIKMRAHKLNEVKEYAQMILDEVRKVAPSFVKRVDKEDRGELWSKYLSDNKNSIDTFIKNNHINDICKQKFKDEVILLDYDNNATIKVATAILAAQTLAPENSINNYLQNCSNDYINQIIMSYAGDRTHNRRHKPGRAFERINYRFEVTSDYGAWRDLQRHRMLTVENQLLTCDLGYDLSDDLKQIDLHYNNIVTNTINEVISLYTFLCNKYNKEIAQYVVPFMFKVRYTMQMNLREAFHILELRTSPAGHSSYRKVCQEMYKLIREKHKIFTDLMCHINLKNIEMGHK